MLREKISVLVLIIFFTAIHSKNLVAIVYLLVALAMHFLAPIRLPEHVSVKVVVVKVSKFVQYKTQPYLFHAWPVDLKLYVLDVDLDSQKKDGILQTSYVTKELTTTTE